MPQPKHVVRRSGYLKWYTKQAMKQHLLVWSTVLSIILLAILIGVTNPTTTGPLGILVVFILMYTSVLGALTYLFMLGSRLFVRLAQVIKTRTPPQPVSLLHAYYYASIVALAPVMLVAMLSVNDMGVREILLVVVFEVVACLYIKKRLG